jgi:hypothetical protein
MASQPFISLVGHTHKTTFTAGKAIPNETKASNTFFKSDIKSGEAIARAIGYDAEATVTRRLVDISLASLGEFAEVLQQF